MSDEQAEYLIDVIRARIPIPLPHVPTDATCGGCRWWRVNKYCNPTGNLGTCFIEPDTANRMVDDPACHRYQEAAK